MICFAAITPHPPIIIPGIGRGDDLKRVEKTINAMDRLREQFEHARPDTVILISPHAPLDPDSFLINASARLRGDLNMFGLPGIFEFKSDPDLAQNIAITAGQQKIVTLLHANELDHGALVPLYFLTKNIKPKLVELSFSFADFMTHYKYGEVVGEACADSSDRVAIIASGDLSHRLIPDAPAGYSPKGKDFDRQLIKFLERGETKKILDFDQYFIEEIGECGLRSFIILLGALNGKYNFELFNYEGPFGVGYLTAKLL